MLTILTLMAFLLAAFAAPLVHSGVASTSHLHSPGPRMVLPALANGTALRVMPLGASITWGQASSDGNGYRGVLRSMLVAGSNPVNMVGAQHHGSMTDNDNEGWPGYVVDQVYAKANASVPTYRPNVILVNAGTNDAVQGKVEGVGSRMEAMLEELFVMSPRATVVLSSLIVNKNATVEERVLGINGQYKEVANRVKGKGRRLVFVDMHADDGPQVGDMSDNTHPNDRGYKKMAVLWYNALVDADQAGMLVAPEPVEGVPNDGGAKKKGHG